MTSFLSSEYLGSRWCRFEAITKVQEPDPVSHAISWKPLDFPYDAISPYIIPHNPEYLVHQYVEHLKWTDITYVHRNSSGIVEAASECARDSAELIAHAYPVLFR